MFYSADNEYYYLDFLEQGLQIPDRIRKGPTNFRRNPWFTDGAPLYNVLDSSNVSSVGFCHLVIWLLLGWFSFQETTHIESGVELR